MRWIGIVLVAACGAKSTPPAVTPTAALASEPARVADMGETQVLVPAMPMTARPQIDLSGFLPDFHEELRWPLSGMDHPTLEPRFPVERQLAIGVAWEKLCERGVHKRVSATQKELLTYLHGWCDVKQRDVDAALTRFKPLVDSATRGLSAAVRHDVANILVTHGDADNAEQQLSKLGVRDGEMLDQLAANFAELGAREDAFAINRRAIGFDHDAKDATKCRRLVKRIALGDTQEQRFAQETLEQLVKLRNVPDETCRRLLNKVKCWDEPRFGCRAYFVDEGLDQRGWWLLDAHFSWPDGEAPWFTWYNIADGARNAVPIPGAVELSLSALENALRAAGECTADLRIGALAIVKHLRGDPAHGAHGARLDRIQTACSAQTTSSFWRLLDAVTNRARNAAPLAKPSP